MASKGTLTVRLIGDSKPLQKTLGGVSKNLGKFVAGVAAAGAAAAGVLVVKGIAAAREAQAINRITENVIRTTGGAANVSASQVDDLSGKLQALTGVSDETIQRGSNMLLTFTNIRNELGEGNKVFDRATGLALDMSVAMGTDVKDSAIQLGKALNDPIKGVTALSRVGIQFTDQQREQIKTLVESGDTLGAQKVILAEVEKQFAGTAEAAADPMQKLSSVIGDVVEVVGVAFLPILNKVATWLGQHLPGAVETAMGWLQDNLVPAFQRIKAWWDENGPAVIAAVQRLWDGLKTAFELIVGAVQTVIGWFQTNRDEVAGATEGLLADIKPIWDKIVGIFQPAIDAIKAIISTGLSIITEFWDRFGSHILKFLKSTWDNVVRVISAVLDVIRGIFETFAGLFTGDWGRMWDGIKTVFGGVWDAIKAILGQALDAVKLAIGGAIAAISQVWGEVWERIKDVFSGVWDGIIRIAKGAVNTIIGFINRIIDAWNGLEFTFGGWDPPGPGPKFPAMTIGVPDIPRIPSLDTGGEVLQTGWAKVHKGEKFSGTRGQYPIGAGGVTVIVQGSLIHQDELGDVIVDALQVYNRRNAGVPITATG